MSETTHALTGPILLVIATRTAQVGTMTPLLHAQRQIRCFNTLDTAIGSEVGGAGVGSATVAQAATTSPTGGAGQIVTALPV